MQLLDRLSRTRNEARRLGAVNGRRTLALESE